MINLEQELSKKQIALIAMAVVVLATLLGLVKFGVDKGGTSQKASLIISFDNVHKRMFQGTIDKNISILQALNASSKAGNFDFRYSIEKSGGVKLYSIADKINETDKKWFFYLNGESIGSESIDLINVKKNDVIEVKYE